ncbi:MAG: alkaline shock response membrane anchor protein AmaP [bacterium]
MNLAYRVSVALSIMILFVIGAGLIVVSLEFITPEIITSFWQSPTSKDALALIGLILWLVCLLVIHTDYKLTQQEKEGVILHNPLGEVKISRTALIEAIQQVGTKEPYVKEIKRTRIKSSRKGLKVLLKAVIWTEIPVPEAMATLQEKIKAYLEGLIGVPKCQEVRVLVVKILHTEWARQRSNREID